MKDKKKTKTIPRQVRWDKLDNTAHLFPSIAGESMTNVYRISVTLKEEVQVEFLQQALDMILPKFDGFNLRMRTGVFWYYFEENGKKAETKAPYILPEPEAQRDLPNPGGNSTAGQDYPVTNLKPGGTYTVGDGETLYGICFKLYGNIRHLDDILAVNHLTDENRIIAGQTLVLPDVSGE